MPLVLKMATPQQRSWCVLQLTKKKSVTAVQRAFRTQNQSVCPASAVIFARVEAANHNCHSFHHQGHSAQSLGRVGLSSRHLPCDSRSTYRVSVRCVQNFESSSIDWCRCEVLSMPHLFSVSFWKSKDLLCSLCIYKTLRYVPVQGSAVSGS
jgi:hypothetical protein